MFETLVKHIRRIAEIVEPSKSIDEKSKTGKYEIKDIKIFFQAPRPEEATTEKNLTLSPDKAKEANFQWVAYQVLFSNIVKEKEEPKYYVYSVPLNPWGTEKPPAKVFDSDSDWSAEKKNINSKDVTAGEVKMAFSEVLKEPKLDPSKYAQTVYINTQDVKGTSYSSKDFKEKFDNNFYVVLNPKTPTELKNPFGKLIGVSK